MPTPFAFLRRSRMVDAPADAPPPMALLLREAGVARDWAMARLRPQSRALPRVGQGAPVLTIPGFMAGDISMRQMRADLRSADYVAEGWRQGVNKGARQDTLARIDQRVQAMADAAGRPVHLVGWSLGGLFAREYAKHHPQAVASVTTMGTPFSGSMQANNAWRLYQLVAGHPVDAPPMPWHEEAKPAVPTFALWSRADGVIARGSARGTPEERDHAIELQCNHMAFAYSAEATDAVIACLIEADAELRRAGK